MEERYPRSIEKSLNKDWITTKQSIFDQYKKSFVTDTDLNMLKSRRLLEHMTNDIHNKRRAKSREKSINDIERITSKTETNLDKLRN